MAVLLLYLLFVFVSNVTRYDAYLVCLSIAEVIKSRSFIYQDHCVQVCVSLFQHVGQPGDGHNCLLNRPRVLPDIRPQHRSPALCGGYPDQQSLHLPPEYWQWDGPLHGGAHRLFRFRHPCGHHRLLNPDPCGRSNRSVHLPTGCALHWLPRLTGRRPCNDSWKWNLGTSTLCMQNL